MEDTSDHAPDDRPSDHDDDRPSDHDVAPLDDDVYHSDNHDPAVVEFVDHDPADLTDDRPHVHHRGPSIDLNNDDDGRSDPHDDHVDRNDPQPDNDRPDLHDPSAADPRHRRRADVRSGPRRRGSRGRRRRGTTRKEDPLMGPHHYHIDQNATDDRRENLEFGVVIVGCAIGEDCERVDPAYDLVRIRRVWQRTGG